MLTLLLRVPDKLFDDVPDRKGTSSLKWAKYESSEIIPLWVADMDFRSPVEVTREAQEICKAGNFGYGICPQTLTDTIVGRMSDMYNWSVNQGWVTWLPGMVCGLNVSCRAIANQATQVITNTPVYPPFLSSPSNSGLTCTQVPMVLEEWQVHY